MIRNALLCHGKAVKTIRARAKTPPVVGVAMAASSAVPPTASPRDTAKARRYTFDTLHGIFQNSVWLDPIVHGTAPRFFKRKLSAADLQTIRQPLDFIGVNVYQPINTMANLRFRCKKDVQRTMLGWPIVPACLYWVLRLFYERYSLPLMVTENGIALPDTVGEDGRVHDAARIEFLRSFLCALKQAMAEGVPVTGYQHWSLLDNFEWAEGYAPRFGLVHVNFETFARTPKDSAYYSGT